MKAMNGLCKCSLFSQPIWIIVSRALLHFPRFLANHLLHTDLAELSGSHPLYAPKKRRNVKEESVFVFVCARERY